MQDRINLNLNSFLFYWISYCINFQLKQDDRLYNPGSIENKHFFRRLKISVKKKRRDKEKIPLLREPLMAIGPQKL